MYKQNKTIINHFWINTVHNRIFNAIIFTIVILKLKTVIYTIILCTK